MMDGATMTTDRIDAVAHEPMAVARVATA